jgi:hypothetical protein
MKILRLHLRLALLLLAAAGFVGLTGIYGGSARTPLPDPIWREGRDHHPSAPELGAFPEVVGEVLAVVTFALAGRIVLRLRLSPASRSHRRLISLALHGRSTDTKGT